MNLLAIETATQVASVALFSDDKLISEEIIDFQLKHSKKLLPSLDLMLSNVNLKHSDIDYYAAAIGPGSFTGLRIGLATIKGLAQVTQKPIIPVSTLRGLAQNINYSNGIVCPVLDARRNQVYNALYETDGSGEITELIKDRAVDIEEIKKELLEINKQVYILGDGYYFFKELNGLKNITIIDPSKRTCKASSIGQFALDNLDLALNYKDLEPSYLRPSYAEEKKS